MAIGSCGSENHAKTELYSEAEKTWSSITDYPYAESHCNSAVIYHDDSYYVFGGATGLLQVYHENFDLSYSGKNGETTPRIVALSANSRQWRLLGSMTTSRVGHSVIYTGFEFNVRNVTDVFRKLFFGSWW